jgi:ubiquinone/menaquinone biosynthesis C-methylase UbiE
MASGESRANDIFNNPNIKSIYRAASRVTGPYAKALVQQSGIVKALSAGNRQLSVLDQACGTGVVAEALHGEFAAAGTTESNWNLKCTDSAQAMLDAMDDLVKEKGWQNVETAKSDILNNGLESDVYDYAFQSFGEPSCTF